MPQVLAEHAIQTLEFKPGLEPEMEPRMAPEMSPLEPLEPLRVGASGRYFETRSGRPFLFIGLNDAVTWPGLSGLYRRRDLRSARAHLENMAAHGVNTLRLMLEYSHVDGRYFERPAGRFNPDMVRLWDDLFEMCEELGLRVLLAPWDNFWMSRRWARHPYNSENGGPAHDPSAFFTHEETIAAIERRLVFVATRWGAALGAWDLFNEIFTNWGGTPHEQSQVLARWSRAIRRAEMEKWGWARPQTVSIFGPNPRVQGDYDDLIFRHPELDFASTHIYHHEAIDHPRDTVAPALSMARWTRFGRAQTPPGRPFTDSEHGPIALFNNERKYLPEDFDDEYERHMMWAHLASGGAGSGMRWPARHPHILTQGMLRALKSVAGFLPLINWSGFAPSPSRQDLEIGAETVYVSLVSDASQAVAWLLRANDGAPGVLPAREPLRGVPLVVSGLEPGTYNVTLWNTHDGAIQDTWQARCEASQPLSLSIDLENDIAVAITSEENAAST